MLENIFRFRSVILDISINIYNKNSCVKFINLTNLLGARGHTRAKFCRREKGRIKGAYDLHTVPTAGLNLTSFVKEAQRKFEPKLYIRSRVLLRISTLLDMYLSNLRNRTHECGGVHQRAGSASPPPFPETKHLHSAVWL